MAGSLFYKKNTASEMWLSKKEISFDYREPIKQSLQPKNTV